MTELVKHQGMVELETILAATMLELKRTLARKDDVSSFVFSISASGRVDGDLKIEYTLADDVYGTDKVTGHKINTVVEEYLRRKGWNHTNAPVLISNA